MADPPPEHANGGGADRGEGLTGQISCSNPRYCLHVSNKSALVHKNTEWLLKRNMSDTSAL